MTLHRSMWKAAVLMGIAGVLMFAGGAWAAAVPAADIVLKTDGDPAYKAGNWSLTDLASKLKVDNNAASEANEDCAIDAVVGITKKGSTNSTALPNDAATYTATVKLKGCKETGQNVNVTGVTFAVAPFELKPENGNWATSPPNVKVASATTIAKPVEVPVLPSGVSVVFQPFGTDTWTSSNAPIKIGRHNVGLKFSSAASNFSWDKNDDGKPVPVAKDDIVPVIVASNASTGGVDVGAFIANLGTDASLYRVVFGSDTSNITYDNTAKKPNFTIQGRPTSTSTAWKDVTGYANLDDATFIASTAAANKFKGVWADNTNAGRGTLTLSGVSGTGTAKDANVDTVFAGGSISGTFPIKKLVITSDNVNTWFKVRTTPATKAAFDFDGTDKKVEINKDGGDNTTLVGITAAEITPIYKEEDKTAAVDNPTNAGKYDVYLAFTTSTGSGVPTNFDTKGLTIANAKSKDGIKLSGQLEIKIAELTNSTDGSALVAEASRTATVTLAGEYYYKNDSAIVIPKTNLTVISKKGSVEVPASAIQSIETSNTAVTVNTTTGAMTDKAATAVITIKDTCRNFKVKDGEHLIAKFDIRRVDATKVNFTYTAPEDRVYNGVAKTATVVASDVGTLKQYDGSSVVTITKKYNGDDEGKAIDVGTYSVTANVPQSKNFNATDDIVVGSFAITRAPLRNNFGTITNWNTIETKLGNSNDDGGELLSGTDVYPDSLKLEVAGNYKGLGDVTYWFAKKKTDTPISTVPADTGLWFVGVTVTRGDNIDSVSSRVWFEKQLKIKRNTVDADAFNLPEPHVVYSRAAKDYTFPGPTLISSSVSGVIDTVVYAITGFGGDDATQTDAYTDYKITGVASKGASFKITVPSPTDNDKVYVGEYLLTATVRGHRPASGAIVDKWETAAIPFKVNIDPRPIDSAGITIDLKPAKEDTVYSGTAKVPATITVKEGATALVIETGDKLRHYSVNPEDAEDDFTFGEDGLNNVKAGTGYVVIRGNGNYTGVKAVPFKIAKRLISATIDKTGDGYSKVYDGTTYLDVAATRDDEVPVNGWVKITFTGFSTAEGADNDDLTFLDDYEVTSASIDNAGVGSRTISATVKLLDNERTANFQLASATSATTAAANNTATIVGNKASDQKVTVTRLDPTETIDNVFNYTIPENHFYSGAVYGIGNVTVKSPLILGAGSLEVQYVNSANKTITQPKDEDVYAVNVKLSGTANFVNGTYNLGTYEIKGAAEPVIANGSPADATVRKGKTVTVSAGATSPNNGRLTYQWRSYTSAAADDTGKAIAGATAATYSVGSTEAVGTVKFFSVKVTNTYDGYSASATSRRFSVTILEAPKPITGATVKIDSAYAANIVYTGTAITLDPSFVTVQLPADINGTDTVPGAPLVYGVSYEFKYANNTNVGTATANVSGVDAYEGTIPLTFQIKKKTLTAADLTKTDSRTYTGDTLSAGVKVAVEGASGIGTLTVNYKAPADAAPTTTVPKNAGSYAVTVDVTEGTNFSAATGLDLGTYTIEKAILDTSWFTFSIPTGHKVGQSAPFGIGSVTIKKGEGATVIGVLYDGKDSVPSTEGSYVVSVDVSGGANIYSAAVPLGTYVISNKDGVLAGNTKIPTAPKAAVVTVAPVKVAAASFTAGPSPVSKNGVIKFFSAKQVKSGSLYIFDANGNAVTKLSAKAGSGEIASWNLKDKKGASVAEGTYVVKGALAAKDGTREKVSFVFSVVK